jgi:hypothetical protein
VLTLNGKAKTYKYHAASGRGAGHGHFPLDAKSQHAQSTGPIPEGAYWISPEELVTNSWAHPFMRKSAWLIWFDYASLSEPYGSGPPYYSGGANMDKWVNPLPVLISVNALALGVVVFAVKRLRGPR